MSIADLLNSTAGRSFKFATIGASVTGTITSATVVQKKDFDSGEPEVWSDGQPVQQVKVSLQTTLRDAGDPEDDGIRNIYIKGWGEQLKELRNAIKAAGAGDLEIGGTFTATYTSDGELAKGKRGFPPKVYAFSYQRPTGVAGILNGQQEPAQHYVQTPAQQAAQQPAPAPAVAPQATPAATPVAPVMTQEQLVAYQNYLATQQQAR
jgi:hypothetical protein